MPFDVNEISEKANGGTEQQVARISTALDPELIEKFQIIPSRIRELDPNKIRILWQHDLPGDPESQHLKDGGWKKFNKIVFVSHYQKNAYQIHFDIPASHCIVLQNAIEPLKFKKPRAAFINLIYHSTPHRGLELLIPVYEKLCEKHDDIHLTVFSSFELYGWKERDEQYKELFDRIKANRRITYHGTQPNDIVRDHLENSDIFAFPSIWPETSCIALVEAMSAGLICVHPDLAALPETSANWTNQYCYYEKPNDHANVFYSMLDSAIDEARNLSENLLLKLETQKAYIDTFYSMEVRKTQWTNFLTMMQNEPILPVEIEQNIFSYSTT